MCISELQENHRKIGNTYHMYHIDSQIHEKLLPASSDARKTAKHVDREFLSKNSLHYSTRQQKSFARYVFLCESSVVFRYMTTASVVCAQTNGDHRFRSTCRKRMLDCSGGDPAPSLGGPKNVSRTKISE